MQRIRLVQWAKAVDTACLAALFTALVLGTGCDDVEPSHEFDPSDVELRDQPNNKPNVGPDGSKGQYIVLMERGANPHAAAAAVHANPTHTFTSVISGFAGPLNQAQVDGLARRPDVLFIEPDEIVSTAGVECPTVFEQECPAPVTQLKSDMLYWGVDRIDELHLGLSGSYTYTCAGTNVPVYVLDTGVEITHSQFDGGRAAVAYDAYGGNGLDCNGHGTHVAGIVAGKNFGVAKQAQVRSVRVLGCNGNGTWSRIIAGMDWVKKHGQKPAVVTMSLSGPYSYSTNVAAKNLAASGVVVVVAAGNDNANACWYSPASAAGVLTVAAANSLDTRASFSNHGSCVDIYAAGTNIKSAWLNNGTKFASGTSMAVPHVAGVAALYIDALKRTNQNLSSSQIIANLEAWATPGKIVNNPANTPDLLLHWPCSGAVPDPEP